MPLIPSPAPASPPWPSRARVSRLGRRPGRWPAAGAGSRQAAAGRARADRRAGRSPQRPTYSEGKGGDCLGQLPAGGQGRGESDEGHTERKTRMSLLAAVRVAAVSATLGTLRDSRNPASVRDGPANALEVSLEWCTPTYPPTQARLNSTASSTAKTRSRNVDTWQKKHVNSTGLVRTRRVLQRTSEA